MVGPRLRKKVRAPPSAIRRRTTSAWPPRVASKSAVQPLAPHTASAPTSDAEEEVEEKDEEDAGEDSEEESSRDVPLSIVTTAPPGVIAALCIVCASSTSSPSPSPLPAISSVLIVLSWRARRTERPVRLVRSVRLVRPVRLVPALLVFVDAVVRCRVKRRSLRTSSMSPRRLARWRGGRRHS